ncbi:hypothetical protein GUJ93_ZPchr0008g12689 [Zizania palustris]|uniref:DUF1409 domain-containing protein n=1 Tax=Zizania palustris TaxID=103762 RepID=A0A8J5R6N1_ZIZPA|nr:hypothetical protein GUJ93_ZPchr0008g12689 [Zizania palustris]
MEGAAGVPSSASTQLPLDVKEVLSDLLRCLGDLVEAFVNDLGPIRGRYNDVLDHLPPELVDALTPVAYLEHYRPSMQWIARRIADRASRASLLEVVEAHKTIVVHEKTILEHVKAEV